MQSKGRLQFTVSATVNSNFREYSYRFFARTFILCFGYFTALKEDQLSIFKNTFKIGHRHMEGLSEQGFVVFLIVMSLMAKFWGHCDFADQSAKLGIVDPYDVLSNFRRGAT